MISKRAPVPKSFEIQLGENTPKAIAKYPKVGPLPTGQAVIDYWRNFLSGGMPLRLFDAVVAAKGPLTREQIAKIAGVSLSSSGLRDGLSKIRSLSLIERGQDVVMSEELRAAIRGK